MDIDILAQKSTCSEHPQKNHSKLYKSRDDNPKVRILI